MKVFVSHSMKDHSFLNAVSNTLSNHGLELLIAEHEINLDKTITEKIKNMIEISQIGLILLTKNGLMSGFVREEIGYLEAKNKPSLIIFEKGIEKQYGGFKYGHEYVELNSNNPEITIEKVKQILLKHWNQLELERKKTEKKNTNIALGILVAVLILSRFD